MKRNILLLEPNYRNKYPPIGLMKLSTYHKKLGDNVRFYKGNLKDLILEDIFLELEKKLEYIEPSINWYLKKNIIIKYLKTSRKSYLEEILINIDNNIALITENLKYYCKFYRTKEYKKTPKYDRVCIATLFTFYWKKTIETIEFSKNLVCNDSDILVGGVMASLIPDDIEEATGIKVFKGLLDRKGILDNNDYIIDELPLDYSILDEIDYNYPESNGYYGYMTRGCKRMCKFCAVPTIEPEYKNYILLKNNIEYINDNFGEQRNLLLLDNNVLASSEFPKIIQEIIDIGFYNGAKYVEPNRLDISISNLEKGVNDSAYIKKIFVLLQSMLKRLKDENQQFFFNKLEEYSLLNIETTTKENILRIYPFIKELYEKYRNKASKARYVDFNQGIDARFLTDENAQLLNKIPIRPLRIAFDSLSLKKQYVTAITLSAKYGIKNLSNYLLYNFKDKPSDLYDRLRINIKLCKSLDVNIYSFPMKFIPITGDISKNREFTGEYWNKKYIRAVQAVLNATKGKIGKGLSFFEKAFGKNIDEFNDILLMPEPFIIYRLYYENNGMTKEWKKKFDLLNDECKRNILPIIEKNDFLNLDVNKFSIEEKQVLKFYLISRDMPDDYR